MFVNSEGLRFFFLFLFVGGALLSIVALGLGIWLFGKVNRQLTSRQVPFPALLATGAVLFLYALIGLAVYLL